MKKFPVILDCDTGIDDAAALILAFASGGMELLGITTVAGNTALENATRNTLQVLELIGAHLPVYPGAAAPLACPLQMADDVHGADGLRGIVLPAPTQMPEHEAAWDAIHRHAVAQQGKLHLIAVGPLTNLATALSKYSDLPSLIERIVIMGGSSKEGNVTPFAEFNAHVDPEAAQMVFDSGIPVYVCGLDVTHQSTLSGAEIARIRAAGGARLTFFADVCQFSLKRSLALYNQDGAHMHDPCAVLYALDDRCFTTQRCHIAIDTTDGPARGQTVTDLYDDTKKEPNAWWVTGVDRLAFVQRVMGYLGC